MSVASAETDVRATMLRLPQAFQHGLTWLTGKALPGQRPLFKSTPTSQLAISVLAFLGGVAGSALAFQAASPGWLLLIPFFWVMTVGNARKLHVNICHQCVHVQLYGVPALDRWICEAISTVLLVQDFRGFQHDHKQVHHGKELATLNDADVQFLLQLGFMPGMTRQALWRRLQRTLVSPRFHLLYLYYRLKANFFTSPVYRRCMAAAFHATLLAVVLVTGSFTTYAVAWLIPLTVVFHISALLQFVCEHRWLRVRGPEEPYQVYLARLTVGRFTGEPAPPAGLPWIQASREWSVWTFKMLFYHLFCRTFVLIGDLPNHDFHHRHPNSAEWLMAAYARQRDIDDGCPRWKEPYIDVWGLHNAIDGVFEIFSELEDVPCDPWRLKAGENTETVLRSM